MLKKEIYPLKTGLEKGDSDSLSGEHLKSAAGIYLQNCAGMGLPYGGGRTQSRIGPERSGNAGMRVRYQ